MRLLLFAGFLGSGKTTLILALARRAALDRARVCVLVNEVGEVGIDAEVLRLGDLEVVEITGGCICCQIGSDLVRALRDLEQDFAPDLVRVEATGIATPEGVLDTIRRYPPSTLQATETVTVVDAARFEALREVLTPLIEGQLAGADYVVVTKADEAAPRDIEAARHAAGELAPAAPVFVVDARRDEVLDGFLEALALPSSQTQAPAPEAPATVQETVAAETQPASSIPTAKHD
jgi:G3E family GTPase